MSVKCHDISQERSSARRRHRQIQAFMDDELFGPNSQKQNGEFTDTNVAVGQVYDVSCIAASSRVFGSAKSSRFNISCQAVPSRQVGAVLSQNYQQNSYCLLSFS